MAKYVDFHFMPLEGKITGKQVLKQTEDAINDLGHHVYEIDIDNELIQQAIDTSNQAIDTAEAALSAVTTNRAMWFNTVAEMKSTNIALGITAATRGKGVFNDGDGAFYAVRAIKGGDVDSDDTVFLDNGNVAERIKQFNLVAKGNNIVYVANVADLRTSDAVAGLVYGTTGYYVPNDGGAGVYNIRTATVSDVDDGGSIIILDNGNVAELIIGDTVNVHQFGAKGNAYFYNYTDGNSYEKADTSSSTVAPYIDNVTTDIVKNYVSAVFETEGTYENPADGKHYVNYDSDTDTYTDEAPYHDNVADKWYVSATYSNKANALLNGTWYYGVVFSTPANDDTTAIQNAINSHVPIELLNGHRYVLTSLTIFPGFILHGNGATIIRPNLKIAPYSYTDNQIKALRMFVSSGTNYNTLQTEIRDVTINGNAFSMWNPLVDSKYKYEQAVLFMVSGSADYHLKILFDNVHFANHFASSITINNYADVIITNSHAYNCLKGICTCVGDGNTLNMDNVSTDSQYGFTAFWVEINSSIAGQRTDYNINNSFFKGRFEFLGQSSGNLNLTNSVLLGSSETSTLRPGTTFNVNITNCKISSEYSWTLRGYGNVNIDNCDVNCRIAFVKTVNNDYNVRFKMSNCFVHDVPFAIGTDNNVQPEIIIDGCRFYNISEYVFGHSVGTTKWQCKNCSITNCVIDTEGYLYSASGSGSVPFAMGGGNDIINPNCQGFNLYGGEQLTFKDEYWSAPAKIKTYRSGSAYNPIGFGKRTTFVAEAPTFRGVNDIDHAQLTVSPYTKYSYTNNAWVADA